MSVLRRKARRYVFRRYLREFFREEYMPVVHCRWFSGEEVGRLLFRRAIL
jgi:hypothetical protein